MDVGHPTIRSDPFLLPQLLYSIPKRFSGSFVIRYHQLLPLLPLALPFTPPRPLLLKHEPVKLLADIPAVNVGHRPHGPDDAAEAAVQHRRGEVQRLVGVARVRELRGMRRGEEGEFGVRETAPRDVEQRQTVAAVQPEWRVERPSGHQLD